MHNRSLKITKGAAIKLKTNYNLVNSFRNVVLAYERYVLSRKVSLYRKNGFIVICDRFPSMSVGKMDSPKLTEENCKYKLLFRAEKHLYRSINQADLLIDLRVSGAL